MANKYHVTLSKDSHRRLLRSAQVAAVFALCSGAALAQPNDDAATQARQSAYGAAMKCFVANGHAMGLRERAGDAAKVSYYEEKARLSFDTAVKLGEVLGFSGSRVNQDFGLAQARELPNMVKDDAYFLKSVASCKALGLM